MAINIAVAWVCVVIPKEKDPAGQRASQSVYQWPCSVPRDWPTKPWTQTVFRDWGRTNINAIGEIAVASGSQISGVYYVDLRTAGLPLRSLCSKNLHYPMHESKGRHDSHYSSFVSDKFILWRRARESNLPLMPLWFGFAVDTAIYGGGMWLIFAFPSIVRRWRRRRRGLCQACGYPIGVNPVCVECGKPLSNRPQTASDPAANVDQPHAAIG